MGAEAARFAAAASQGNVSMGQLGVDNQTMWQYNTQPITRTGAPVHYSAGSNGIITTHLANGQEAFDSSLIRHNTSMRLTFGERMASTFQQQSESAQTAAASDMVTSAKMYASGLQQAFDFARSHGISERTGTQTGTSSQIGFSQAVNEVREIANTFARDHGLSQGQSAEILGIGQALIKNPQALNMLLPLAVQASARMSGGSSASAEQTLKSAVGYLQKDGHSEALSRAEQAIRSASFDRSDESARRAVEGISSSFSESRTHADMATAHLQRSESYKEMAGQLKESSGAFEASMYHRFMGWMSTQYNSYLGRNFDGSTVSEMAEKNPELLVPFLDTFYKEHMESMVSSNAPQFNSPDDIRHFFVEQSQMMGGAAGVQAFHGSSTNVVSGFSGSADVSPDRMATSEMPGRFGEARERVIQALGAGNVNVESQGGPLQEKAVRMTDPGSQPLTGIAGSNAAAGSLPDSLGSKLLDKVPGIDMSIAVPGAAVPEAQQQRMQQGAPQDPKMDSIRNLIPKVPRDKGK